LTEFARSREGEVDGIYAAGMVGSALGLVDKALSGTENTIRFIREDRLDLARSSFAMRRNVSRRFVRELGNAADTVDD
jgi:DNA-binding transcriptional regulator YiaG